VISQANSKTNDFAARTGVNGKAIILKKRKWAPFSNGAHHLVFHNCFGLP
jgi:hypothetical protein